MPRVQEVESSNPKGGPSLTQRCLGAMTWRWAPQTRYTLRRNTTRIMKGLVREINSLSKGRRRSSIRKKVECPASFRNVAKL